MARLPNRSVPCAATLVSLVAVASLAAAQQQAPAEPSPEAPATPGGSQAPVKAPAVKPTEAPVSGSEQELVGLDVFSSEGTRVGQVRGLATGASGDVIALLVRTGGFLGFGGRTVSIPEGRFTRTGQSIRLDMDTAQVSDLPEVNE